MADGILIPCNVAQSWHWFRQVTAPYTKWHVALESWQWIHQVAAPSNVISRSGMTCHWIRPVAGSWNVTRSSWIMTLNSPGGSTLQCGRWLWDDMSLNSPKRPPNWNSTSGFDFDQSPQSTCHSAPVCEILSKSDHHRQKKMTSCWFSRWRILAILDFRDPIVGSLITQLHNFL